MQVDSQNSSAPTLRSGGEGGVYSFTRLSYGFGVYKTLHGIYLQTFVPYLCQIPRAKKYVKNMKKSSKTEPKILQKSIKKVIEIRAGPRDAQKSPRGAAAWSPRGLPGFHGSLAPPMGERTPAPGLTSPLTRFNSRLELARATRALVLLIRPPFGPPLHFLSSTSKAF